MIMISKCIQQVTEESQMLFRYLLEHGSTWVHHQNVYINKLGEIVEKCSSRYHGTIKMKPAVLSQVHLLTVVLNLMTKILCWNLVIMLEYQNAKIFFQKASDQIGVGKSQRSKN